MLFLRHCAQVPFSFKSRAFRSVLRWIPKALSPRAYLSKSLGRNIYQQALLQGISSPSVHLLDDQLGSELARIVEAHQLSDHDIRAGQKQVFSELFRNVTATGKVTDEQNRALCQLLRQFGMDLTQLDFNEQSFNRARILSWVERAEHRLEGELPVLQDLRLRVRLSLAETLHWLAPAFAVRRKMIAPALNQQWGTGSAKIIRGVTYRAGSLQSHPLQKESLAIEEGGLLWISNQRFGFQGTRKHFSAWIAEIESVEAGGGILKVFRRAREFPYLISIRDLDTPAIVFSALMNQSSNREREDSRALEAAPGLRLRPEGSGETLMYPEVHQEPRS